MAGGKQKRRSRGGKQRPPGLSAVQVERLRTRLRGSDGYGRRVPRFDAEGRPRSFAASQPWIDEQIVTRMVDVDGVETFIREHEPNRVPKEQVRCKNPACHHLTPPTNVTSSGHCDDCYQARIAAAEEELGLVEEGQSYSLITMGSDGTPRRFAE